jgi:Lipocalin-like domain
MKHIQQLLIAMLSISFLALRILTVPALADDRDRLIGNWKLISLYTEDAQSKQRVNPYGELPKGHAVITADRLFALVAADRRKPPQTSDEEAAAFRSMIAYTGKYRVENDKFITTVDLAWNEAWVGTEQVRFFRVDGDKLSIITAPMPNPNKPDGTMIGTVVWERE